VSETSCSCLQGYENYCGKGSDCPRLNRQQAPRNRLEDRVVKTDHERIWLQNAEDAKHCHEGRMWCEDKAWPIDKEDG
jgi:hypothetical protein